MVRSTSMTKSLRPFLLLLTALLALPLFSSCVVTQMPPPRGVHAPVVQPRPVAVRVPAGLIVTTQPNWYYDPYRRCYYDMQRRAYFNYHTGRYYTVAPRRYNNCVYPQYWNRRGTCPGPRSVAYRAPSQHCQTRIVNPTIRQSLQRGRGAVVVAPQPCHQAVTVQPRQQTKKKKTIRATLEHLANR